ncbi:RNA polymerase sigma-70 factor [Spirosoma sp. HMF3257]|uniref:RNA polymerase sigma-70 factor n=1 Tax=Spirosoma telluris TaxID=2183553 RepID=A0A327NJJ9_9BACT|nr:RNA polymerase sigma-70 factor [Spirosoma telluris]RAI75511.1 RNA polymerase sigma-70 factor [Spirosoma telluris]
MGNSPLFSDAPKAFPFTMPEEAGPVPLSTNDPELLIRRGFEQNPQLGCELLYHRYYQNLCSYAVRFVLSKEVAEDIVSDVFLTFWKNATYQQITVCYGAYFYRAVRNRAYNYLRQEVSRTQSFDSEVGDNFIDTDTPEAIIHFQELAHRLDAEIQALPPQCRKAFMLNRYEGKRYVDIAEELHISQKAVEHLISRALTRLRTHLTGEWLILVSLISLNSLS